MTVQAGSFEQSLKDKYAHARATLRGKSKPPLRRIRINNLTPDVVCVPVVRCEREPESIALPRYIPTIARIIEAVAAMHRLRVIDVLASRRAREIVEPRHIIFYLASTMTMHPLTMIGKKCGGRDHTTVLHGVRKITGRRTSEPDLNAKLEGLETLLSIDPRVT